MSSYLVRTSAQDMSATSPKLLFEKIASLCRFAREAWQRVYDYLLDTSPPREHQIDQQKYVNPFLDARAEDFNHNFEKLARLFQGSPASDSIQRRTDNVFIEGGRGTGKSMLLRRLTAQAVIVDNRSKNPHSTYDTVSEDYFGIYLKLTRGYYEQFQAVDTVPKDVSSLLSQHQLNVEIFDAFISTLIWLQNHNALPDMHGNLQAVVHELGTLFPQAPSINTLEELSRIVVKFEQNEIAAYYRGRAFGLDTAYNGSAVSTVDFVQTLSQSFKERLFPKRL